MRSNLPHDFRRRRSDIHRERFLGRFEGGKLTIEHAGFHEMILALREPLQQQSAIAVEVHELYLRSTARQLIAISGLQRGTRDYGALLSGAPIVDSFSDRREPGRPVGIVERLTGGHLGDVRRRMKFVGIRERPIKFFSERTTDGRFAAARYAHDDDDHDVDS